MFYKCTSLNSLVISNLYFGKNKSSNNTNSLLADLANIKNINVMNSIFFNPYLIMSQQKIIEKYLKFGV